MKVEADYLTAKVRESPSRICTETPRRWCYHPRQKANLVMVNPNRQFVVDANALLGRNPISAFDGVKLDGVISRTIIGGRP